MFTLGFVPEEDDLWLFTAETSDDCVGSAGELSIAAGSAVAQGTPVSRLHIRDGPKMPQLRVKKEPGRVLFYRTWQTCSLTARV